MEAGISAYGQTLLDLASVARIDSNGISDRRSTTADPRNRGIPRISHQVVIAGLLAKHPSALGDEAERGDD
jgi:hypothetical protein